MNKTPAVRFKGFTEDWEQRKLCEITTEKLTNGVMNYRSVEPTDVRHINVINMYTSDEIHIDELSFSAYDDSVINKCNVEFGDVFLTRSSLKPEGIAEPNVLLANGRFVFDDHLIRMKINKKKYDPCFIKICLETRHIKEQFIKSSKTTAFTTIGQDDIAECIGFFPDITEQKSLALIFSSIDNLITLHQHKYEKLKNIKKSMLYKMFPQNGRKVPEIRFTGFTDDWEQRKLGEVVSSFEYGLNAAAKEFDGVNKYLRITDIDDSSRVFKDDDLTSPDTNLSTAGSYQLNDGEILFARTGASVGKSFIYRESDGLVYYAGFLIRAKVKPEYDSEFIFQNTLGASYEKYIQITSQRSGQPGVNAQEYAEYTFLVPDYSEQKKIGGFLRQTDNLITLHQRKLEKLKQLKQAMLHKMFV